MSEKKKYEVKIPVPNYDFDIKELVRASIGTTSDFRLLPDVEIVATEFAVKETNGDMNMVKHPDSIWAKSNGTFTLYFWTETHDYRYLPVKVYGSIDVGRKRISAHQNCDANVIRVKSITIVGTAEIE